MMNWRLVLGLFFYTFLCLGCAIFLMNDLVSFYYKKGKRKEIKKTQTLKEKVLFSKYKEKKGRHFVRKLSPFRFCSQPK